jgi:hypothetical protein
MDNELINHGDTDMKTKNITLFPSFITTMFGYTMIAWNTHDCELVSVDGQKQTLSTEQGLKMLSELTGA